MTTFLTNEPRGPFLGSPRNFSGRKAIAKSRTLRLQTCFIYYVSLIWTEVPLIQEVSGAYTSPFLDTDELKVALPARKVSGVFEKWAPGRVVWKPVNATPGLKGNEILSFFLNGNVFFWLLMVCVVWDYSNLNMKDKQYKRKTSLESKFSLILD